MHARFAGTLLLAALAGSQISAPIATAQNIHGKPASNTMANHAATRDQPLIQIAVLLDTSGSMSGLINQARTRIWDVVNELTLARFQGEPPRLEIALYQYGSARLPAAQGYLEQLTPLTTDLDLVSEKLFELNTNGGEEYCGWAINAATKHLFWDERDEAASKTPVLRAVIIAGNEPFTQGPVPYQSAIEAARAAGVLINTIHCGTDQEGQATGWLHGAHIGGGAYHSIDHNQTFVEITAPQDALIAALNAELNGTYLPFGAKGVLYQDRQVAQDDANYNASRRGFASRALSKSSSAYSNSHWDLIDACKQDKLDLSTVSTAHLPAVLQPMTLNERLAYIETMAAKRLEIQIRIRQLVGQREAFIRAERARHANIQGETLDSAIVRSIREQAQAKGFIFPDR